VGWIPGETRSQSGFDQLDVLPASSRN
jgi:hypothetical protein